MESSDTPSPTAPPIVANPNLRICEKQSSRPYLYCHAPTKEAWETSAEPSPMSPWSRDGYLGLCLIVVAIMSSTAMAASWEAMKEMDSREYHQPKIITPGVSSRIFELLGNALSSPTTLLISIAITSASLTTYRYLHRNEKQQGPILMAFLLSGVIIGKLFGFDGIGILLQVSPSFAILGFMASTCFATRKRQAHINDVLGGNGK